MTHRPHLHGSRFVWRSLPISFAFVACASLACGQNVTPSPAYREMTSALREQIQHEMQEKQLSALSIALVDGQTVVWAQGFGFEDAQKKTPATAHTVYRVGSVSKLFTDIAVMRLVEKGQLDLDTPVTRYLPEFAPHNPFGGEITLRELMAHRAGLVREPPVGHYFDDSAPTLEATIASLNQTTLVYAPGTHTKYSNAGVAAVGEALQRTVHQPYAAYLKQELLEPLGMHESAFAPEPALKNHLAAANMWSYDGLSFPAPEFQLGEGPAGAMYSTVTDLGRFMSVLFANGHAGLEQVISPTTLAKMWTPQFAAPGDSASFGIGFRLSTLEGEREVGHGGAIYGFATQLSALPDAKLGVVVITATDGANAVTTHLADEALRMMLAQRRHAAIVADATSQAVPVDMAKKLAGDYAAGAERIHLDEQNGSLYLLPLNGGSLAKLRAVDGDLFEDSRVAYSPQRIHPRFDDAGRPTALVMGNKEYARVADAMPKPIPLEWAGLIGEYGWDYDKLYVLENEGRLWVLVEWFDFEPLKPKQEKEVFQLPDHGLYVAETVSFQRDSQNAVTGVKIGSVTFPRRPTSPDGAVFQITPLKPVAELRREALALTPPRETGSFHKPDLVELTSLDPTIHLDIRYATDRNFLGSPVYLQARAFMQRPAAEAVARASQKLHALGYGLLIHDSYRPWYVTKMFWDGTPDDKKIFVANPAEGSRHNRGCAVDLTLYDLKIGNALQMTGGYDEMSERSYPFYPGGTSLERWHRDLLRHVMEQEGFTVYEYEWWHFDYNDWRSYPILNLTFEQLDSQKRGQ